jgi:hypothetical protein
MDDQGAVKQSAEVSAAKQSEGPLWQARGRARNVRQRTPKKRALSPATGSRGDEGSGSPETRPGGPDTASDLSTGGQDQAATVYGRDRSLAPVPPPKGTVIDIAI